MGPRARSHELSTLDRAHAHRLAGEDAEALRLGVACAQAAPGAPGPAALLTRLLIDSERSVVAPEAVPRLVDAFVRRGDLPQAVVAAQMAADADGDFEGLLDRVANAFGEGSPRVGEGGVQPPPFPKAPSVPPQVKQLDLAGLYGLAERIVSTFMESDDPVPPSCALPRLPLFGSLKPAVLAKLLRAARVDEVSAGTDVVRQGDPGTETFVVARGLLKVVRKEGADETVLAELGPGAVFGEMALVSATPRSASVVAVEPAQLLVLVRDELERLAPEAPALGEQLAHFCRSRMEANLIANAPLLQGVPAAERVALLGCFGSRYFEPGQVLLEREQQAQHIYLIASGSVSVSVPDGNDRLILATLGPGDVCGEISMILRRPTNADVVALYPTIALDISEDKLREVMREHPSLLVELYDLATRRDDETNSVMDSPHESADTEELIMV